MKVLRALLLLHPLYNKSGWSEREYLCACYELIENNLAEIASVDDGFIFRLTSSGVRMFGGSTH